MSKTSEGWRAFAMGKSFDDNPYHTSDARMEWYRGWAAASDSWQQEDAPTNRTFDEYMAHFTADYARRGRNAGSQFIRMHENDSLGVEGRTVIVRDGAKPRAVKAYLKHKGRALVGYAATNSRSAWDADPHEAIYMACAEPSDVAEMVV